MAALATLFPAGLSLSQGEVLLAVERGVEEVGPDVLAALLGEVVSVRARRAAGRGCVDACAGGDIAAAVAAAGKGMARPVTVDCLHALRFAAGVCHPSALLHCLARASAGGAAAVVPAMSPTCSAQLLRGARHVLVIDGLASGAAADVHGTVQVVKRDGRWRRNMSDEEFRFRVREDGKVAVFR